ncbi:hypothetical protein SBV1_2570002 [Verrucomicrobia bacterium]|nr:hypothetical protein SBV1_2570002 [Verrucomicrobiota bacterium]
MAGAAHAHETPGLLVFGPRRCHDGSHGCLSRLLGIDWVAPLGLTEMLASSRPGTLAGIQIAGASVSG